MNQDELRKFFSRYKDVALFILAVLIVLLVVTSNAARPDL